jgi:hypothetical protein
MTLRIRPPRVTGPLSWLARLCDERDLARIDRDQAADRHDADGFADAHVRWVETAHWLDWLTRCHAPKPPVRRANVCA